VESPPPHCRPAAAPRPAPVSTPARPAPERPQVEEADLCVEIPMVGFVESYNVSVAAALVMWTAREDRIRRLGKNGDLTGEEIETMMGVFALRSNYKTATFVNEAVGRAEPARGIVRNSATPGFGLAKELKMLEEQVEELVTSSPQK